MSDLVQAIADARSELRVLARHGASVPVDNVLAFVDTIADAAYPFTTFISEADATVRSGHLAPWFRNRFADWERQGYARVNPTNKRERQYMLAIIPLRHDMEAIREDARRTALGEDAA